MGNIIHPNYNPYEDHNGCLPWVIGCFLVCIFLFSGCRTKYIPVPVESTDSIVIRDTIIDVQLVPYSDTVIVVPEQESNLAEQTHSYPCAVLLRTHQAGGSAKDCRSGDSAYPLAELQDGVWGHCVRGLCGADDCDCIPHLEKNKIINKSCRSILLC